MHRFSPIPFSLVSSRTSSWRSHVKRRSLFDSQPFSCWRWRHFLSFLIDSLTAHSWRLYKRSFYFYIVFVLCNTEVADVDKFFTIYTLVWTVDFNSMASLTAKKPRVKVRVRLYLAKRWHHTTHGLNKDGRHPIGTHRSSLLHFPLSSGVVRKRCVFENSDSRRQYGYVSWVRGDHRWARYVLCFVHVVGMNCCCALCMWWAWFVVVLSGCGGHELLCFVHVVGINCCAFCMWWAWIVVVLCACDGQKLLLCFLHVVSMICCALRMWWAWIVVLCACDGHYLLCSLDLVGIICFAVWMWWV